MIPTPYAFRIMGGVDNARQLVDYARVFTAYCLAHPAAHPEIPAYLSAFTYPVEFRRHLETTGSTRDYHGPVGVPSIKWDIDRDGNLDAALHDTRRLSAFLADRYRLDADDLLIGFSGSKGFHVELPVGWMVEASPDANLTCRRFAEHAANEVGVTLSTAAFMTRSVRSGPGTLGTRKRACTRSGSSWTPCWYRARHRSPAGPPSRSRSTPRSPRRPLRCLPPGMPQNATSGVAR